MVFLFSSGSALYVRYSTDSIDPSTGFKATFTMTPSVCGNHYINITENSTDYELTSPKVNGVYPANLRCTWIIEAPYSKILDITFQEFDVEDSEKCSKDRLILEDDAVKNVITEGLGENVIYRGKLSHVMSPSFYMGMSSPISEHVYCGTGLPHDYLSQTHKMRIKFETNDLVNSAGFKLKIGIMKQCARNFTSLQGRLVSSESENCIVSIKVPENYTISLFFVKFFIYEQNCENAGMKVYDGSIDNGELIQNICGYTTPNPIFSKTNEMSLRITVDQGKSQFGRYAFGNYDITFFASNKGRGCGGKLFNYGGVFSSPLYPSTNRSNEDCTWDVTVPKNMKVALRFSGESLSIYFIIKSFKIEISF